MSFAKSDISRRVKPESVSETNQPSVISRQASIKGFTLLEMLVVLVLIGLISTLLIQGLSHILNMRLRFLSQLERETTERLQFEWFHQISDSLVPDHADGENLFSGNKTGFQGLTLSPLKGNPGIPTPVIVALRTIEGKILLQYKEGDGEVWELARWLGRGGEFSYLDKSGEWHSQWPPRTMRKSDQLPEGILLEADKIPISVTWFAALRGRHNPKPTLEDLLRSF